MLLQGKDALGDVFYNRHQPEQTLLYKLVEAHYPALVEHLGQLGKHLPAQVRKEFDEYLKCGRLEHGFLRVRCDKCNFERLVAFSCKDSPDPRLERVAKANGFSLHAGVSCEGHQKNKRERLCRYIARPAVAVPRLSLSSTGKVVYSLKTPYRDGTTQVAFDPVDFIARLAALVPKLRVNLTRYHGVLAPNHRWRGLVTPARAPPDTLPLLAGKESSVTAINQQGRH